MVDTVVAMEAMVAGMEADTKDTVVGTEAMVVMEAMVVTEAMVGMVGMVEGTVVGMDVKVWPSMHDSRVDAIN